MARSTKHSDEDFVLTRIGERIRQLRQLRGDTVPAAATRAGLKVGSWEALEAGTGNPSVATLVRVALALDTTVAALVADQPTRPSD